VTAPWITAIAAPHLVRAVAEAGGDAGALAARFALPDSPRYEDRLPLGLLIDAWEAAIAATGRRDLPLLAATRAEHDEHSLVAFIVANQPRLGDGIALLDRFYPTVSNAYRWRQIVDDAEMRLRAEPPGPVDRLGWQAYLESEAFDMIAAGRRMTSGRATPRAVRFLHAAPAPDVIAAATRACGVEPVYAADATEIVWPAAVLGLHVPTARPHLATLIRDRLEALLLAIDRGDSIVGRARLAIAGLLRDGGCDVARLARAVGMSRRSLERALADDGTSATALIDDERRQLALAWLPALSVDEVASRLGYSDARAFARAFKRWTGHPPSQARR
jgi:AraC-like DNA-binding protein